MRVLVYDVAAETSGVLSILYDFRRALQLYGKDVQWEFVIGRAAVEPAENIHVFPMPQAKKSWFHRLYYDYVVMPRFVKTHGIDVIFSLQNVTVPFTKCPQYLYMHQPIPFEDYRFRLSEKSERVLWLHQNIVGKLIFRSIRKAKKVFVQTRWIKEKCQKKLAEPDDKFLVIPPSIDTALLRTFDTACLARRISFFYPATAFPYKNHIVLLRAAQTLVQRGFSDFTLSLTVDGIDCLPEDCRPLCKGLETQLVFCKTMPRESVMEKYASSVLLFPSKVETFGLPLLEARLTGAPAIAADKGFAHEILDGYENVTFFAPDEDEPLAQAMQLFLEHTYDYQTPAAVQTDAASGWKAVVDVITA